MDDIIKAWLTDMYDTAISEAESAIGNERIWQKGASSDADITMHEENISRNEKYIAVLEKLKGDVERM